MKVTVNYRGIYLEVEGTPYAAQGNGWDDEYEPAHFEAETISLEGVNICELISGDQWSDIEALAIKECDDE